MASSDHFREVDDVLEGINHTFKIGINGFGSLGRAIFCSTLVWPYVRVTAINDPSVNAEQAADILRKDGYRDYMRGFKIDAISSEELLVRDSSKNISRTVIFCSEQDPTKISWKSPRFGILYVIECSGSFQTIEDVSRHLHTGRTYSQELNFKKEHGVEIWDEGGAMKVLVASTSTSLDIPTFEPGDERDCRFQDYVLSCAPPKNDQNWDLGEYSRQVLKLLNVVLARDSSVTNWLVIEESGRGPSYGEKGPFLEHLESILASNMKGSEPRSPYDDGIIEGANRSDFLGFDGPCGCCQGQRSWRRTS